MHSEPDKKSSKQLSTLPPVARRSSNKLPPTHIAIIMDGNGRWATERGLPRLEGHKAGAASVRKVVEECCRLGVRYLTLYTFSTENWERSESEVSGLMSLFRQYLSSELPELMKNGIRLRAVGNLERLPSAVRLALSTAMKKTKHNSELDLVLAVSYGAREELLAATREAMRAAKRGELEPEALTEEKFEQLLWTNGMPDPDLLIRTSGEMRISNFLLWQIAYSELVTTPTLWPAFDEQELRRCIDEYAKRERRFGLTQEQLATAVGTGA